MPHLPLLEPSDPASTSSAADPASTSPKSRQAVPDNPSHSDRPRSGSTSLNESSKEDSGGAGNETDDEREASDDRISGEPTKDDSDEQVPPEPRYHHEMYPFPSTSHHRHSSAEVEASSAGSSSSTADSDSASDLDDDEPMQEVNVIKQPTRTLSEYRASLSRAGLAAPPKIRRIGALGISVHSDSDVENPQVSGLDTNDRIDPASGGDTSNGTRETDLGVSLETLQAGTGSGSRSGSPSRRKGGRRRKRGIADATFRGIVDELAVENRHLKDQLRRYEAHGVPLELKDSRLFEIRFFDGLPIDKRLELERYLTGYVRDFVEKAPPSSSAPPPSQPVPQPPSLVATARPPTPRPSHEKLPTPPSLPSPQESDRSERYAARPGRELAEASNSGLEPPSLSGIGSGVYRPAGFFPSENFFPRGTPNRDPVPAITTEEDRVLAKAVIAALEQLFRHSLQQKKKEEDAMPVDGEQSEERSRSNETYMANFLSHDYLSDGWVYLNLASTMAELHRFSVTLNFVQQAIRDLSSNLEVSDDGKRIRWIGPSPAPSDNVALNDADAAAFDDAEEPSNKVRPRTKVASPAPTDSQVSSGTTTATNGSRSSNDHSSLEPSSMNLANSLAPTSSTAPTSQAPSKSMSSKPTQAPRPQRPTAAVLQRMDRLSPTDPAVPDTRHETTKDSPAERRPAEAARASPKDRLPQRAVSFVAHPSSALRPQPNIFHRLLRNQIEEELAWASPDLSSVHNPPRGPGMLVFYANGHFCSDLIQDDPLPASRLETDEGFVLGDDYDAEAMVRDDVSTAPEPIDLDDEVDLLQMNSDPESDLSEGEQGSSIDSHASSLARLKASGMTNTIPADLFTILVKTGHARKRRRDASSDAPDTPSKQRRVGRPLPRIVSSRAVYHRPQIAKRTAPVGPTGEAGRFSLTTSNLAKHTHPSLEVITPPDEEPPSRFPRESYADTPSPPHDDYLLSLSAPLHAWAPRELNSHLQNALVPPSANLKTPISFRRKYVDAASTAGRSFSELSTTTTGDERPISLDDLVAPVSATRR
ncbi:hypothetical protein JCM10212_002510 [Sporobolomyces blumeae]